MHDWDIYSAASISRQVKFLSSEPFKSMDSREKAVRDEALDDHYGYYLADKLLHEANSEGQHFIRLGIM